MPTERMSFTVQQTDKADLNKLRELLQDRIGGKLTLSQVIKIAIGTCKRLEENHQQ